jgi:hypothetical protein
MKSHTTSARSALLLATVLALEAWAQEGHEVDPSAAVASVLTAACKQSEAGFANYLTVENADAYRALPASQRLALLKRISLLDDPGRALISSDAQNHTVLRCTVPDITVEYRLGSARVHENLAFIPVEVVGSRATEFGMVREGGGWRVLSVGLLLFSVPELSKQWTQQDLVAREDAVVKTLRNLAEAIDTFRRAFGNLPESLEKLGPAPKEGRSPDAAGLIDAELAAGSRAGYGYRYRILPRTEGAEPGFELAASPIEYGKTGRRSFFLDVNGKLHAADKKGAVATAADAVISSDRNN